MCRGVLTAGAPLTAGYGEPGFLASYLGVQAHGILWPAAGAPAPAIWPITPPMVSAKVRMVPSLTRPITAPICNGCRPLQLWSCHVVSVSPQKSATPCLGLS